MFNLINRCGNIIPPRDAWTRGTRPGSSFYPAIIADRVVPAKGSRARTFILEVYENLLRLGINLEVPDNNGHTHLFFAIAYVPMPLSLKAANRLLDEGADPEAVNNLGDGLLHVLLKRLSTCSSLAINEASTPIISSLLTRILRGQEGAPTLLNNAKLTPFDVAMSPAIWPIFCSALQEAGHNIEAILRSIDRQAGILSPSPRQVEEQCRLALATGRYSTGNAVRKAPFQPLQQPSNEMECYICGEGPEQSHRPTPFDQFLPCVVSEQGMEIHDMFPNHSVGYLPEEMSWRRWTAFRLQEKGYLGS